jgi:hypothetical protein
MTVQAFTYKSDYLIPGFFYETWVGGGSSPCKQVFTNFSGVTLPFQFGSTDWPVMDTPIKLGNGLPSMVWLHPRDSPISQSKWDSDTQLIYWAEKKLWYDKSLGHLPNSALAKKLIAMGVDLDYDDLLGNIDFAQANYQSYQFYQYILNVLVKALVISETEKLACLGRMPAATKGASKVPPFVPKKPIVKWILKKGVIEFPKAEEPSQEEEPPTPIAPKKVQIDFEAMVNEYDKKQELDALKAKIAEQVQAEKAKVATNPIPSGPPKKKGGFTAKPIMNNLTGTAYIYKSYSSDPTLANIWYNDSDNGKVF